MELFEGLKEGDLNDLVLPLVNIDEYETKLDDDAIVVAFYVKDREPASDLNRFIQKGAVSLLDTDVSPAPNEDGYYVVFVELVRDNKFPKRVMDILDSLRGLTSIKKWRGQFYDHEGVHDVTLENLKAKVRLLSADNAKEMLDDAEEVKESLYGFFKPSILESMDIKEGEHGSLMLEFNRGGLSYSFSLVDFGTMADLKERNEVLNQALRLDEVAQANVRRLQGMLGSHWLVEHLEDHVLLSHYQSDQVALLKL